MSTSHTSPRVFVCCAPQDGKFRELIAAKVRHDDLPVTVESMIDGRTDDPAWQLECRRRIRKSTAVVVLVSAHTSVSVRAMWQVRVAREEGRPIVGVTVGLDGAEKQTLNGVIEPTTVIGWKWKNIATVLMRLAVPHPPAAGRDSEHALDAQARIGHPTERSKSQNSAA